MKYQILFATVVSLCGVLSTPLVETPETRASLSCQTNLTVTTTNTVTLHQTSSFAALTSAFFTLNLNLFTPAVYEQYNWFYFNYATVGFQLSIINTAMSTAFGASIFPGGLCGRKSVSDAMVVIVNALNQANTYYATMDSAGSAAMSTKIQAIVTLQGQINTAMSCANTWQTMFVSCPDSLVTMIAQMVFQSSSIMMQITTGWCGICSSDPSKCAVPEAPTTTADPTTEGSTTSTEASTTTTEITSTSTVGPEGDGLLNFTLCLATIGFATSEAALALGSSFWELNINLFSAAISGPYAFFLLNIGMAFIEGTVMGGGMLLYGSYGVTAIETSSSKLIMIIQQAASYIEMIDPAAYAEISIEIEMMISIQVELIGKLKQCKNDMSPLWHSCGKGPYFKLSWFISKFAFLMNRIIVIWCNICSVMPEFCENPMTTSTVSVSSTTPAETTTSTIAETTTTTVPETTTTTVAETTTTTAPETPPAA